MTRDDGQDWARGPGPHRQSGDVKCAPEPASYPRHFTPEQRVGCYWFALRNYAIPATTSGWEAIEKQRLRGPRHVVKAMADDDGPVF